MQGKEQHLIERSRVDAVTAEQQHKDAYQRRDETDARNTRTA